MRKGSRFKDLQTLRQVRSSSRKIMHAVWPSFDKIAKSGEGTTSQNLLSLDFPVSFLPVFDNQDNGVFQETTSSSCSLF